MPRFLLPLGMSLRSLYPSSTSSSSFPTLVNPVVEPLWMCWWFRGVPPQFPVVRPRVPAGVEPPKRRLREKKSLKRGRRHAIAEAVRPIPGSTVDQIALLKVISECGGWVEEGTQKNRVLTHQLLRRGNL